MKRCQIPGVSGWWKCALVFWVLSLVVVWKVPAREFSMRGFYIEGHRADRGLPQNTVQGLLQTRDGYLWIVTPFGLARFDGVTFKTFTAGNTPGLREDMFTSVAEDRDGVFWAGTRDGLLRYEHGIFERLDTAHGLPNPRVDSLYPSRKGGVWAATPEGVAHVHGRRARVELRRMNVSSVFESKSGDVWFSVSKLGVHRWSPEKGEVEMVSRWGERGVEEPATCYFEDADGTMWFGTGTGLHSWRNGEVRFFPRYGEELPLRLVASRGIESILKDRETGDLWVAGAGDEGLQVFRDGEFRRAVHPNWPALRHARRILQDAEGNLWVGTDTDGLIRLRRPRLQTFGVEDGLLHDCMWSVCTNREGGIWASGIEGFSKIVNGRVTSSNRPPEHWSEANVRAVLEDRSGQLWVADHLFGLYRFTDGMFHRRPMDGVMKSLYEDRSGAIWVGTSKGMTRLRGDEAKHYTTEDGLSYRDVRAFLEDSRGTLWIGTYGGGITHMSNGVLRAFKEFPGTKAWAFHEDNDGVIWIGTDHGLYRYDRGRWFVFTTRHGLFDNLVNHIVEDDGGNFWISCNAGIYRVQRSELNDVAAGRIKSVNHVAYGEADGMITSETNGEYQPAGCRTSDGRMWFPTQRGIVMIDPKTVYRNELAPPVIIERVAANDRIIFGKDVEVVMAPTSASSTKPLPIAPVVIPPGGAEVLEIRYTANSFVDPSKMRFKYWLHGHDKEWRDAGNRRVAYYTNLRPGKYRFRVIAANNHGYWNEEGAEYHFSVKPHYYETWPFYGVCMLGFVGCAAGIQAYRLSVQRRFLRLEQEAALQRERERIAQDMHDDLGANLTKIAMLSEVARQQAENPEQARSMAGEISDMARSAVDNISEIVWVTNPHNDDLENLVGYLRSYAAEYFENTPINCVINFPEEFPVAEVKGELRRDILLVFKEALHNAARHSGASQVDVVLKVTRSEPKGWYLLITVSDNGRGFDVPASRSLGNGLENMVSRLQRRGGLVTISSKPQQGTRVTLSVPLAGAPNPSTTFM